MTRESSDTESEVPGEGKGAGESQADDRTDTGPVDWGALQRTRRAYRVLFLICILLYVVDRIRGLAGSDTGWVGSTVFTVASMLVFAAFLYYFLRTAGLLGYSGIDRFGMGLLAVVPGINLFAVVILDLRMGAMISRRERAGDREGAATTAGGEAVTRARVALVPRLLTSLLVGIVVFAISCGVFWNTYLNSVIRVPQELTLDEIARGTEAVDTFRREKHSLPRELTDLPQETFRYSDETGAPADWWRRPLDYWTDGTHYRITSYGYDGEPGGVGLHYDLSSDDVEKDNEEWGRLPPEARVTFEQFATDWGLIHSTGRYVHGSGGAMFLTSVFAGIVAFVLGFVSLGSAMRTRRGVWAILRRLAITIIGTVFLATIIATIHVPSGH